jgi:parallel beta-helix repeat protein
MYAQYDSASATYRMPSRNTRFDSNIVIGRATLSENSIGIASLGSSSVGVRNDNIVIENNIVIGAGTWDGGAGALSMSYSDNSVIRNNTVYQAIGCGISMRSQCNRCIVENNVVNGVYGPTGAGTSIWANVQATNTDCLFRANRLLNTTGNSAYNAYTGIFYTTANTGTVFARNRIQSDALVATPTQRFINDSVGSTPNTYTDLRWELETESCAPFTHTAVGGAPREATASQISNFRRTPATGWTTASTIARARVSYRSTNTTYQIAVRPNEGNAYTVGVYTVDGTNITAATSIPDIYITIEGIYWVD